jgi:hypothetical protein
MPVNDPAAVVLESPAVLARLLLVWRESSSPGRERAPASLARPPEATALQTAPPPVKRTSTGRICACGQCARCLDNARWNKVFEEKFADPSYYAGLSVRRQSSLARL